MDKNYDYNLIITIVNRGMADAVMDVAKGAGATGGTYLHGHGADHKVAETFFGISIKPEKDVLFIVAKTCDKHSIMQAISKADIYEDHKAFVFSLPVDHIAGAHFKK
jgi:hypothetical protein